ncbi:MAG: MazG-like family protein [Patescibacteria group bacterium]|nr:MazG-like family protein [Patescibacteria group bacterium]
MKNWTHSYCVWSDVKDEIERQDQRFGKDHDSRLDHNDVLWSLILGEEYGEVQKQTLENLFVKKDIPHLREELIQVIAVAVQWIMAIDQRTSQ